MLPIGYKYGADAGGQITHTHRQKSHIFETIQIKLIEMANQFPLAIPLINGYFKIKCGFLFLSKFDQ